MKTEQSTTRCTFHGAALSSAARALEASDLLCTDLVMGRILTARDLARRFESFCLELRSVGLSENDARDCFWSTLQTARGVRDPLPVLVSLKADRIAAGTVMEVIQ